MVTMTIHTLSCMQRGHNICCQSHGDRMLCVKGMGQPRDRTSGISDTAKTEVRMGESDGALIVLLL